MDRRLALIAIAFVFGHWSCADEPDQLKEIAPGVFETLLGFDEQDMEVQSGVYAEIGIYLPLKEAWCGHRVEWLSGQLDWPNEHPLQKPFERLNAGDSVRWSMPWSFFETSPLAQFTGQCSTDTIQTNIDLIVAVAGVYDSLAYPSSPRALRQQRIKKEQELINDAMQGGGYLDQAQSYLEVPYIVLAEGDGLPPSPGEEMVLAYKGTFLDGRVFDDARDSSNWLYTPYGKPDQVVRGIEIAVSQMLPGERRLLWLRSDLAFRERGSRGIVPPHTPVCFDLTLVDVLRPDSSTTYTSP